MLETPADTIMRMAWAEVRANTNEFMALAKPTAAVE
jgi:hypothetical protein